MKRLKFRLPLSLLSSIIAILVIPTVAYAVVQSLNGATGMTQTFINDSNVTITTDTLNNTHALGWSGQLPVSRGGTGSSSFSSGSVLFSNGTSITQDNSNLFWDNTNNRLGIGTSSPAYTVDIAGDISISGDLFTSAIGALDATINNTNGPDFFAHAGSGLGSGSGGMTLAVGGAGGETGDGGEVWLEGGRGGTTSGNGGIVGIVGGIGQSENSNGGGINLYGGTSTGSGAGGGVNIYAGGGGATGPAGPIWLQGGTGGSTSGDGGALFFRGGNANGNGNGGNIDFAAGSRAGSGTGGIFKFDAEKPTIYIGGSSKAGCIVLGDSDGSGVTYVIANDGVLSASTTKPSSCQ